MYNGKKITRFFSKLSNENFLFGNRESSLYYLIYLISQKQKTKTHSAFGNLEFACNQTMMCTF